MRKLAVLISFSGDGGVERMMINLLHGLVAQDIQVDVLLIKARGVQVTRLPPAAHVIPLPSRHTFLNLPALIRYLRQTRPTALLAVKHRALLLALWARRLSGISTRIVGRIGTTVTAALKGKGHLRFFSWRLPIRWLYPWADGIVAVSHGVAEDISMISGLSMKRLTVIYNPVITPALYTSASSPPPHPWLQEGTIPVIMGMGRFTEQKDFPTLIRAYAKLRQHLPCRLIIVGRGRLLAEYQALAESLGVADHVAFPGYSDNPYSYLARARLFVLSSAWEGSPNALTEALALGIPAVSTDCPSGPREILQDGRHGPLVTVGDVSGMARAMAATLAYPPPAKQLKKAVFAYTVEISTRRYLDILTPPASKR